MNKKLAEILLIEDNEGDIILAREAFADAKFRNNLHIARDGAEALNFLHKRGEFENAATPDIVLLDLNLPKVHGKDVLSEIKSDPDLKHIPVVVLTSSEADKDVLDSYELNANCYIVKPIDAVKFINVIQNIESFWVEVVCLPTHHKSRR